MRKLTAFLAWVATMAGAAAVILFGIWGIRSLNSAATSVTVHTPEPGIHCAVAVTDDGVAIDCWPVERRP